MLPVWVTVVTGGEEKLFLIEPEDIHNIKERENIKWQATIDPFYLNLVDISAVLLNPKCKMQ